MRKIILYIACSLDGYIAGKNGDISWLFHDADYGYKKFYSSVDTILCGRKTYETAKKFEKIPFDGKQVLVFSRNAMPLPANAVRSTSPVSSAKSLLNQRGKNIWLCGGSQIISALLNAKLCHEIIVSIHPIILGGGIPLFAGLKGRQKLKLIKSSSFKSGLVQLSYKVVS